MNVADRMLPSTQRIGLVCTYPPTLCGLATFAHALGTALAQQGHDVHVVRVRGERRPEASNPRVVASLRERDPASLAHAAALLSSCDTVILQHEYGIYGGADGAEVLELIEAIEAPVVVVLHTVPLYPTPHQHQIIAALAQRAQRLVVMSETAHERLCDLYPVREHHVDVIPHGAATPTPPPYQDLLAPQLLTWGLLGPGKGIEHTIAALAMLATERVRPRYTIAGVTHPNVFERDGDRYRNSLQRQAANGGVASAVTFDDQYRDTAQLTTFIASAEIVVLPYDSTDQVTSGVLVDAIAAGRPVIATAFPHAVELLASGAGIVVPHRNPTALATAIRSVVMDQDLTNSMAQEASRLAPTLSWATVAAAYARLGRDLQADASTSRP